MHKTHCLINLVCQKIISFKWMQPTVLGLRVRLNYIDRTSVNECFPCVFLNRLKWHDGSAAGSAALSAFSFFVLTVTSLALLDQIPVNPLNPFLTSGPTTGRTFALGKHGKAAIGKWTVSWQNVFSDRIYLSSPLKRSSCILRIVGWGFPDCHDGLFHSLESF